MKMKFKDGKTVEVTRPVEKRLFGNDGSKGWILGFSIISGMVSEDIEELLSEDNISDIQLMSDDEKVCVHLKNYNKATSINIRYSDSVSTVSDVQLIKEFKNV